MSTVQPTDKVLVNRAGTDYSATADTLMATIQDTDLLLVNRAGVDYKCSGADFKAAMGPGLVAPPPADVSAVPAFASGTGTQADPYILAPVTVGGAGGAGKSVELITIANVKDGDFVEWTDNSTPNPNTRFKQAVDVAAGTTWSGHLTYMDTPASTVGGTHTGDLQIGTTYFRWVVTQDLGVAPDIATAALADVPGGNRFTSTAFPVTFEMAEDGTPASTKKLKAWVQGALKAAVESDAITAVNTVPGGNLFSTTLYTGTNAAKTITTGVDLAGSGGMLWVKGRDNVSHAIFDTTRGVNKILSSNAAGAEIDTSSNPNNYSVAAFTASGFDLGPDNQLGWVNGVGGNFVAWSFAKAPGFFDVVTWTGDGSDPGMRVPHSLGSTPGLIIAKKLNAAHTWYVYHRELGDLGYMQLNTVDRSSNAIAGYGWDVTATDFRATAGLALSNSGDTFVAYLFAHDPAGAIQCGSFTTDGSGNATVNLGWEPQWVLYKRSSDTSNWNMFDSTRGVSTGGPDALLKANLSNAEASIDNIGFTSTGFNINDSTNKTYIYIAIKGPAIAEATELTLASATGLTSFAAGDAVTEIGNGNDATGKVSKVDAAANKLTVSKSTAWDKGSKVKGPLKAAGSDVKLFCTLAAGTGTVTDLQSSDPGFQTWTATAGTPVFGQVPYSGTLTFPATMPSGQAPDVDLPAGTAVQVEVEASNTVGSDTQKTNLVTPT